ncbi:hypothetical protein CEXT_733361 [Caerostris extrusa]|uniref:Uncharacterized protein n=1 Tax=Caerostris extrusa TaxID=172846 RepID=A0AAV4T9G6_CAEEX|nr:hypothetical protein CEXT_733361 [Caerostris extrusa]
MTKGTNTKTYLQHQRVIFCAHSPPTKIPQISRANALPDSLILAALRYLLRLRKLISSPPKIVYRHRPQPTSKSKTKLISKTLFLDCVLKEVVRKF